MIQEVLADLLGHDPASAIDFHPSKRIRVSVRIFDDSAHRFMIMIDFTPIHSVSDFIKSV